MSVVTVLAPLPLPRLLSLRGLRQYYQSWLKAVLSPGVRQDVVEEIRARLRLAGEVAASCRCGALQLVSEDAPRQVAVCHCSVCRSEHPPSSLSADQPTSDMTRPGLWDSRRPRDRVLPPSGETSAGCWVSSQLGAVRLQHSLLALSEPSPHPPWPEARRSVGLQRVLRDGPARKVWAVWNISRPRLRVVRASHCLPGKTSLERGKSPDSY